MALIPYRDENNSRIFPVLTLLLITTNVIVFIMTSFSENFSGYVLAYGYQPKLILQKPQVLITSIFMHAGILHLVSNMWFLWLFGDNIEDRFGRISFLLIYIFAGIIGNFTHSLFTFFQLEGPVIGASGAVAGVMGSYMVRFPKARIRAVFFLWIYPLFIRIKAFWFIGLWLVFEFFSAIVTPHSQVAHWAHIGGFLFGAVWAYGRGDKSIRRRAKSSR